jgi:hypothetical protein
VDNREDRWSWVIAATLFTIIGVSSCSDHKKTERRIENAEARAIAAIRSAEQANRRADDLEYRIQELEDRLGM